jgi:hypothetical protein
MRERIEAEESVGSCRLLRGTHLGTKGGEGGRKGKRRTVELARNPGAKSEVVDCPGGTGGLIGKSKIGKMTPVQVQRGARQICFAWVRF